MGTGLDTYQQYLEIENQLTAEFSQLNPKYRTKVLLHDINGPLLLWAAFVIGLGITRAFTITFARAEDFEPMVFGFTRDEISLLFSFVLLSALILAFLASVLFTLFHPNPSRQSAEMSKFLLGFATGTATNFLNPYI